ncbi:MAG: hypothetical protein LUE23_02880 [Lachnospiraceae bacterium]|nr:hypothetical protein [Lachnospiraceae bacterium]
MSVEIVQSSIKKRTICPVRVPNKSGILFLNEKTGYEDEDADILETGLNLQPEETWEEYYGTAAFPD